MGSQSVGLLAHPNAQVARQTFAMEPEVQCQRALKATGTREMIARRRLDPASVLMRLFARRLALRPANDRLYLFNPMHKALETKQSQRQIDDAQVEKCADEQPTLGG